MIHRSYRSAEKEALRLSALGQHETWLVVDTGTDSRPVYRVWREATVNEQERKNPMALPCYEVHAYCHGGRLVQ